MVAARTAAARGNLLRRRTRESRLALIALFAILIALGVEIYGWRQDQATNTAIARDALTELSQQETARGLIARALIAQREGLLDDALAAYSAVDDRGEERIAQVIQFNVGGLFLEKAVAFERQGEDKLRISLIEQAKENYRGLLARNPEHYDARYNLSRALQMLPDLPDVSYGEEVNAERAPQAPQANTAQDRLP